LHLLRRFNSRRYHFHDNRQEYTMSKPFVGIVCIIGLLAAGCTQKQSIRDVSFAHDALSIRATLSPGHNEPQAVVGHVVVRNSSSGFLRYGNMRLFLVADGKKAVTRIRTAKTDAAGDAVQVDPMADTKMIELAPGDSLVFASFWQFDAVIKFEKASFSLEYDTQAAAPVPSDSSRRGDSAGTTTGAAGSAAK
jgi:hypothetical protein